MQRSLDLCLCMPQQSHWHMMRLFICVAAFAACSVAMGELLLITNQSKQGGLIIISLVVIP